jgi:predicted esterase
VFHSKPIAGLFLMYALAAPVLAQQSSAGAEKTTKPEAGVIVPHVGAGAADQSYALYLPSHYSEAKRWPIVYAFDPLARGNVPVEMMKEAAERYGFIVAGSNNSRNGSWKIEIDAAQAMSDDTHTRLLIDDRRVYFAGFSGGARVAAHIAQVCKCAAGVMLNGAGFPVGRPPTRDSVFPVFATVGDLDFNYPEVTRLDQTLAQFDFPHALRNFAGPHQWAPVELMDEAFAWFRLIAMRESREPRDDAFVAARRDAVMASARSLEQAGDSFLALRLYREAAVAFDGLTDTTEFRREAGSLAAQKVVREAEKRQRQELDEQDSLTREISAGLNTLSNNPIDRAGLLHQIEQSIVELRNRTTREARPDKARVLQRACADVFARFIESGQQRVAEKDPAGAKDYFALALAARPDSTWALQNLAIACALSGDRKSALDALRRAKEKAPDAAAFSTWLAQEAAFRAIRDDPKFKVLASQ